MELVDKIGEAIEILRGNISMGHEESLPIFPSESNREAAPVEIADTSFDDLNVEHVYLDEHGKVIETITEIAPDQDNTTESRMGKTWTEDEENLIKLYYQQGKDFITIASLIGRTEVAMKTRLSKLGLIEYTYGREEKMPIVNNGEETETNEGSFTIENSYTRCSILNKYGEN